MMQKINHIIKLIGLAKTVDDIKVCWKAIVEFTWHHGNENEGDLIDLLLDKYLTIAPND